MPPKPASVSCARSLKFQLAVPALGGAEGRDTGLAVFFAARFADFLAASLADLPAGLRAAFFAVLRADFVVGFLAIRVSVAWVRVKALPDRLSKKIPLPAERERAQREDRSTSGGGARLRHEVRPQRLAPIRDGVDLLFAQQDLGLLLHVGLEIRREAG